MLNKQHLPIAVFDSGVGGLTVLRCLQQHLPYESFLYLGDTARLPYGTKSPDTVIRYVQQASQILIDQGVKLLVIACNTASTLALPALQQYFPDIPVVGVLEPSAKAACEFSRNGHIAVIATEATVYSQGYQNMIKKYRPQALVTALGCSLLVALAEEGWIDGPIAEAITQRYLEPLVLGAQEGEGADCLILGCTHFPVLAQTIHKVIDGRMQIIDSATAVTEVVKKTLIDLQLANPSQLQKSLRFIVTDSPVRFARVAKQFLAIDISPNQIELVEVPHRNIQSLI